MIILKPYQTEAVLALRAAVEDEGKALLVMATGLGKTLISATLWRRMSLGRGLFLAHSNAILEHARQEYAKIFSPDTKMALYNGYSKDIVGADIVFATHQTLKNQLGKFNKNDFGWMTADEAHHSQASTWKFGLKYFNCPKLGITATPDRMDLKDIREIFGIEIVNLPLEEAIARNLLPKIEYFVLTDAGFDNEALKELVRRANAGEKITKDDINSRVFIKARDEKVAQIIQERGQKGIVFCRSIAHAEEFSKHLPRSEVYHSKKGREENAANLNAFKSGDLNYLLAVDQLNEGVDMPDADLVVFLRPTESPVVSRQQLGRALRGGKEKLVVLDFVGNVDRIKDLHEMAELIREKEEELNGEKDKRSRTGALRVSGEGFSFEFSEQLVDLVALSESTNIRRGRYETLAEASAAVRALGIKTYTEYLERYTEDVKLPSNPNSFYQGEWTGRADFLGTVGKYKTLGEFTEAVRRLGITDSLEYERLRTEDKRFPASPHRSYKDWPGWESFQSGFLTYEETRNLVRKLGIKSWTEYIAALPSLKVLGLPRAPSVFYRDKGWVDHISFFGEKYYTLEEAKRVCKERGVSSTTQYIETARRVDSKLPPIGSIGRLYGVRPWKLWRSNPYRSDKHQIKKGPRRSPSS